MLKPAFLSGSIALLLGSAAPPPVAAPAPAVSPPTESARAPDFASALTEDPSQSSASPIEIPPQPVAAPPPQIEEPVAAPPPQIEEPASMTAPQSDPSGVRIVVSLPLQKAYVFEDGELLWAAPVSTGKRGHPTPVGTFPILQKTVHHRSSKYDNAPMPYMQRLTWYGIALHAGRVPGYPASHGCIRLPRSYAKKLYDLTDHGTTVTITRARPASAEDALDLV